MAEETSFGVARLRQAITNQATCVSQFELSIESADKLCRECEDELARLAWAEGVPAPVDADGVLVPLDVDELFTNKGEMIIVDSICFNGYFWYVKDARRESRRLDKLHRTKQDSWELLERDVLTLATSERLADPESDAKECIRRAKALAERDAKASTPQSLPHEAKETDFEHEALMMLALVLVKIDAMNEGR